MKSPLGDRESRRNNSAGEENIAMNRNSILIIILSVVVVVAAIAGLVVNLGSKENKGTAANSGSSTAESTISVDENTNALQENQYPAVNELIANYRKAFKEGDTDLLKKVYNSDRRALEHRRYISERILAHLCTSTLFSE